MPDAFIHRLLPVRYYRMAAIVKRGQRVQSPSSLQWKLIYSKYFRFSFTSASHRDVVCLCSVRRGDSRVQRTKCKMKWECAIRCGVMECATRTRSETYIVAFSARIQLTGCLFHIYQYQSVRTRNHWQADRVWESAAANRANRVESELCKRVNALTLLITPFNWSISVPIFFLLFNGFTWKARPCHTQLHKHTHARAHANIKRKRQQQPKKMNRGNDKKEEQISWRTAQSAWEITI